MRVGREATVRVVLVHRWVSEETDAKLASLFRFPSHHSLATAFQTMDIELMEQLQDEEPVNL